MSKATRVSFPFLRLFMTVSAIRESFVRATRIQRPLEIQNYGIALRDRFGV